MAELPGRSSCQLALARTTRRQPRRRSRLRGAPEDDTSPTPPIWPARSRFPALDRPEPEAGPAAIEVLDAAPRIESAGCSPSRWRRCGSSWPGASSNSVIPRRRQALDAYLDAMEKNTMRYGGDYRSIFAKQHSSACRRAVRAGLWPMRLPSSAGSSTRRPIPAAIPRSTTPWSGCCATRTPAPGALRDPPRLDDAGQGPQGRPDPDLAGRE